MITVDKALKRGKVIVSIPVLVITYSVMGFGFFLWISELASYYLALSGIFFGHLLGWIYRGFAITRWRIWAFNAVNDVHELKSRAIANKLILPDGHIFEKTEIRTRRNKELLKSLEIRFNELPKNKEVADDPTIPPTTKVFHSRIGVIIITIVMISACASFGTYVLVNSDRSFLGIFFMFMGVYFGIKTFRKMRNTEPQLILDEKGIKIKGEQYLWSEIKNVTITYSSNTWLTLNTNHGEINTTIDGLDISSFELQDKLNIYQLRFMKATTSNV